MRACWFLAFILGGLFLLSVGSISGQEAQGMVKGVRMVLEYYQSGEVKSQLMAKEAMIPKNESEEVTATGVRGEFYKEDGTLETVVAAEDCTYNRTQGVIKSDGKVRLDREDVVISGTGFSWDSKAEVVSIKDKTKVIIKKGLGVGKVMKQ